MERNYTKRTKTFEDWSGFHNCLTKPDAKKSNFLKDKAPSQTEKLLCDETEE